VNCEKCGLKNENSAFSRLHNITSLKSFNTDTESRSDFVSEIFPATQSLHDGDRVIVIPDLKL
jgi:uncharacterized Zn ribbon protein